MLTKKLSFTMSFFVIIVPAAIVLQTTISGIMVQNVLATPTVTVSQTCAVINGINNAQLSVTGSGWPPSPNRGVVLIDGVLALESEFTSAGILPGATWIGPGGPIWGAGSHPVIAFHDFNGNQHQDPGELSAATSFTSIVCGPNPCSLGNLKYSDAAEMNSVVTNTSNGLKVKTIHVEKEVFNCQAQPRPNVFWPIIVDVSIFTEIIESPTTVQPIKNLEVITCQKNATTGDVLGCKRSVPSANLPASTCSQVTVTLPVEMNTVQVSPGIVKTIKAEKEVFFCDTPNDFKKIKDVIIFTEILENLSTGTTKKAFEVVTCLKDIPKAEVIGCKITKTRVL